MTIEGSVQIRPQIAFRRFQIDAAPLRIIFQLVAADAGHTKIFGLCMTEIEAADRRRRQHRKAFRQRRTGCMMGVQHLEQDRFQTMFRAGGIAGRRADAAILFLDQRFVRQLLALGIAPERGADIMVQPLGEGFGQTIGQRL